MNMPSAVDKVKVQLRYIELMETCGCPPGSQRHRILETDTVMNITNIIKNCKTFTTESAVELHAILGARLEKTHVDTIMTLIQSKVGRKVTDFNLSKQKNPYLDNYLTESHWQAYMDPRIAAEPKLMSMALLMHALGCFKLEEELWVIGVCLAMQSDTLNQDVALVYIRKLKEYYRNIGEVAHRGPLSYPETPQELQTMGHTEIYNLAYEKEPPVPSKWSPQTKAMLVGTTPCRNSKSGCNWGTAVRVDVGSHMFRRTNSPNAMQVDGSQQLGLASLPGFRWLTPSTQHRYHELGSSGPATPASTNIGNVSRPQAPIALPAITWQPPTPDTSPSACGGTQPPLAQPVEPQESPKPQQFGLSGAPSIMTNGFHR